MSILHTAKWCEDRQKCSTHAGHDHSKNISSMKELRNNVGKITSHLHIIAVLKFYTFLTSNFPDFFVLYVSTFGD